MAAIEGTVPFFMPEEAQILAKSTAEQMLRSGDSESISPAARNLIALLNMLGQGEAVSVFPVPSELSISEAAKILGASESYITDLLDSGTLAFREEGNRRRIALGDLLACEKERKLRRKESIGEMIRESQRLGLY